MQERFDASTPRLTRPIRMLVACLALAGCTAEPSAPLQVPVTERTEAPETDPAPLTKPPRAIATH